MPPALIQFNTMYDPSLMNIFSDSLNTKSGLQGYQMSNSINVFEVVHLYVDIYRTCDEFDYDPVPAIEIKISNYRNNKLKIS